MPDRTVHTTTLYGVSVDEAGWLLGLHAICLVAVGKCWTSAPSLMRPPRFITERDRTTPGRIPQYRHVAPRPMVRFGTASGQKMQCGFMVFRRGIEPAQAAANPGSYRC